MYPVSANFHTLAIQDAPKTRVRIYFIGDAVDCTDDNAVQTSGTLLIGKAGDTDSNGRIGQNGVVFNELFNPDKNIQIGRAVSSQIGMTLLNTDGALDNFQYGRCKVYLDVYDSANLAWLACPMGVYIIELPTKRKVQLINAVGFDQMTKLDAICDTWWNGLNWSGGLTLLQIVNSMAAQLGVSVSSNTASAIVNSSLSYTAAPFDCVEVTYREVLEVIAEATGTVARFDRDGALDLRWRSIPTIGGNSITINTDTVGNQCLSIDAAEYSVSKIDLLRAKFAEGDIGVTVGSGTNEYVITNNLFLNGANTTDITNKITPIYNRLNGLAIYNPVNTKMIWDWSIEAGDVVYIVRGGTTYYVLIFQQTMTWRGGYVVADVLSDGDAVRPVLDASTRDYYRLDSDMRTLVIEAPRINLLGYTTINNGFRVNLDGTFEANGAVINGNFVSKGQTVNNEPVKTYIENGSIGSSVTINGSDIYAGGILLEAYSGEPGSYNLEFQTHGLRAGHVASATYGADGIDIEVDGVTRFLVGSGGAHFGVPLDGANILGDLNVTDNTYLADTSVGGVLKETNRIASDHLSTPGWYRVCWFEGISQYSPIGALGALIRFNIVVYGNDGNNGNHQIDYVSAFGTGNRKFTNEHSNGVDTKADKIRCMRSGNDFYIDVHFNSSAATDVYVFWDFFTSLSLLGNLTTQNLAAVADAPSGETVLAEYSFSSDGVFFGDLYTNGTLLLPFLTKGTAIPSNADMNTYTTPGVYYATTAVASTLTNANITTVAFKLIVMPMTGSDLIQIHMADFDNCIIAMRRYNGSTWSGYRRITPVAV